MKIFLTILLMCLVGLGICINYKPEVKPTIEKISDKVVTIQPTEYLTNTLFTEIPTNSTIVLNRDVTLPINQDFVCFINKDKTMVVCFIFKAEGFNRVLKQGTKLILKQTKQAVKTVKGRSVDFPYSLELVTKNGFNLSLSGWVGSDIRYVNTTTALFHGYNAGIPKVQDCNYVFSVIKLNADPIIIE